MYNLKNSMKFLSMALMFFNASFVPTILAPLIVFGQILNLDKLLIFLAPFLVPLVIIDGLFIIIRSHVKAIGIGIILGLILTLIWIYILTWILMSS